MEALLLALTVIGFAVRIVGAFAVYHIAAWLLSQANRARIRRDKKPIGPRALRVLPVALALVLVI